MAIQGISSSVKEVGKHLKKSKRHFTWNILVDGTEYTVEMIASHISRKKKILLNDKILYDSTEHKERHLNQNFQFPFQIDVNLCNIVQKGETFEFYINNMSFDQICGNQDQGQGPKKQVSHPQHALNDQHIQPPSFIGDKYKEDLGDLSGLRGIRTKNTLERENKGLDDFEGQRTIALQPHSNSYNEGDKGATPTATQKFKGKLGDLSSFIGIKSKNKDSKEDPNSAHLKESRTVSYTEPHKDDKKDVTQTVAHAANVVKEKFGDLSSFIGSKLKNKDNKENKTSTATLEKSKTVESYNEVNYSDRNSQTQTTLPMPPTVAQLYKEEIGDLSGLRGVRTKGPKKAYTASNKENEPYTFGVSYAQSHLVNYHINTKELSPDEKVNQYSQLREVDTNDSDQFSNFNKGLAYQNPQTTNVKQNDFWDFSQFGNQQSNQNSQNNYNQMSSNVSTANYAGNNYSNSHSGSNQQNFNNWSWNNDGFGSNQQSNYNNAKGSDNFSSGSFNQNNWAYNNQKYYQNNANTYPDLI